jgi:hypothetical protein
MQDGSTTDSALGDEGGAGSGTGCAGMLQSCERGGIMAESYHVLRGGLLFIHESKEDAMQGVGPTLAAVVQGYFEWGGENSPEADNDADYVGKSMMDWNGDEAERGIAFKLEFTEDDDDGGGSSEDNMRVRVAICENAAEKRRWISAIEASLSVASEKRRHSLGQPARRGSEHMRQHRTSGTCGSGGSLSDGADQPVQLPGLYPEIAKDKDEEEVDLLESIANTVEAVEAALEDEEGEGAEGTQGSATDGATGAGGAGSDASTPGSGGRKSKSPPEAEAEAEADSLAGYLNSDAWRSPLQSLMAAVGVGDDGGDDADGGGGAGAEAAEAAKAAKAEEEAAQTVEAEEEEPTALDGYLNSDAWRSPLASLMSAVGAGDDDDDDGKAKDMGGKGGGEATADKAAAADGGGGAAPGSPTSRPVSPGSKPGGGGSSSSSSSSTTTTSDTAASEADKENSLSPRTTPTRVRTGVSHAESDAVAPGQPGAPGEGSDGSDYADDDGAGDGEDGASARAYTGGGRSRSLSRAFRHTLTRRGARADTAVTNISNLVTSASRPAYRFHHPPPTSVLRSLFYY